MPDPSLAEYNKTLTKGNGRLGNDGSPIMYISPKGNILTQQQWQDNQSSKMPYTSPEFLINRIDGYAKPDPIESASMAAAAFRRTPKAQADNYQPGYGMAYNRLSGTQQQYIVPANQMRVADSTQFVDKYNQQNGIIPTQFTPQQRMDIIERLKKNGG
jgi:hypothetical protein